MTTTDTSRALDWTPLLLSQLEWHWENQLRPRLDGLSDDEYFWKPVDDVWTVGPRSEATTSMAAGAGELVIDWAYPAPDPAPVTTIAWRIGHIVVGIFGDRNARYFGGPEMRYDTYDFPATAAGALAALDAGYEIWHDGVASLDAAALAENSREVGYESDPMAALVLHIHREVIHHGAEIALLRDLYLRLG